MNSGQKNPTSVIYGREIQTIFQNISSGFSNKNVLGNKKNQSDMTSSKPKKVTLDFCPEMTLSGVPQISPIGVKITEKIFERPV